MARRSGIALSGVCAADEADRAAESLKDLEAMNLFRRAAMKSDCAWVCERACLRREPQEGAEAKMR